MQVRAELFWQDCQNCVLCVQRDTLRKFFQERRYNSFVNSGFSSKKNPEFCQKNFWRDVRTSINLSHGKIWGKVFFVNFLSRLDIEGNFFRSFGGIFSTRSDLCFLSLTRKVDCKTVLWKKLISKIICDSYRYLNGVLVKLWQCCQNCLLLVQKSSMRKNGLCGSKFWTLLRKLSWKISRTLRTISDKIVKTVFLMSRKTQRATTINAENTNFLSFLPFEQNFLEL